MKEIAPHVAWLKVVFVNVYFVGERGGPWFLVDSGIPSHFEQIRAAAEERFGETPPQAIFLTHGHFDHSGSALALATFWDVPVYAHRLDLPYLTGKDLFPPPDPTIGGAISFMSRFFPPNGTDLGDRIHELPENGIVPGFDAWRWHFTPGHSPGHVSYFRAEDKMLIAGDAFATVNMDSPVAMTTQKQEIARPPAPVTCDWPAARRSLIQLAGLSPFTVACGHGNPMAGPEIAGELQAFAEDFIAPLHGRYVPEPARTDENGVVALPPAPPDPLPKVLAGVGVAAVAAGIVLAARRARANDKDNEPGD